MSKRAFSVVISFSKCTQCLQALSAAAGEPWNNPLAQRLLAQFLLNPGRQACHGELKLQKRLAEAYSPFARNVARARQLAYQSASGGDMYVYFLASVSVVTDVVIVVTVCCSPGLALWAQLVGTGVGAGAADAIGWAGIPSASYSASVDPRHRSSWLGNVDDVTGLPSHGDVRLAVGLLHLAAASGSGEAYFALGSKYARGVDVPQDDELAMWYTSVAADDSSASFHTRGNQVIGCLACGILALVHVVCLYLRSRCMRCID